MPEEQPYVRYRLEAKIAEKGIAFSLKQAILGYLHHHNLKGRITEFYPSSDRFEAILSIYPGGNHDLNMSELSHHIDRSGRLPSQESARPKITITPIAIEGEREPQRREKSLEDTQWQHSLDEVTRKHGKELADANRTIEQLTHALTQRQEVINNLTKKTTTLETRLREFGEIDRRDPQAVMLSLYVGQGVEEVLEGMERYISLAKSGDTELYAAAMAEKRVPSRMLYLNKKCDTHFETEEELQEWVGEDNGKKWEESKKGKELLQKREEIARDREILEEARKRGASATLLQSVEEIVRREEGIDIDEEIRIYKSDFERDSRIRIKMRESISAYEIFARRVREGLSDERKATLPIVIVSGDNAAALQVYAPSLETDNEFVRYLTDIVKRESPDETPRVRVAKWSDTVIQISLEGEGARKNEERLIESMKKDRILLAVGIEPKITVINLVGTS